MNTIPSTTVSPIALRQVEKYPKRARGPGQLAKSSADAAEGEPFERDSSEMEDRSSRRMRPLVTRMAQ
jgi:hypothetical protein